MISLSTRPVIPPFAGQPARLSRATTAAREAGFSIVPDTYCLVVGTDHRPLTRLEYRLLTLLVSQPGRVFGHDSCADALDPTGAKGNGEGWSLTSIIYRLRKKMIGSGAAIKTRSGFGYTLEFGGRARSANHAITGPHAAAEEGERQCTPQTESMRNSS